MTTRLSARGFVEGENDGRVVGIRAFLRASMGSRGAVALSLGVGMGCRTVLAT